MSLSLVQSHALLGLEALREPLETGRITISKAARRADFAAQFLLIAAEAMQCRRALRAA